MTPLQRSFIIACLAFTLGLLVASMMAGCARPTNYCGPEVWDCGEDY